eukprot:1325908-Rhodomonas_salina.1
MASGSATKPTTRPTVHDPTRPPLAILLLTLPSLPLALPSSLSLSCALALVGGVQERRVPRRAPVVDEGVRGAHDEHGAAGPQPRVRHHLVARQRVVARHEHRGHGGLGARQRPYVSRPPMRPRFFARSAVCPFTTTCLLDPQSVQCLHRPCLAAGWRADVGSVAGRRPLQYESCGGAACTDIICPMYPSVEKLIALSSLSEQVCALLLQLLLRYPLRARARPARMPATAGVKSALRDAERAEQEEHRARAAVAGGDRDGSSPGDSVRVRARDEQLAGQLGRVLGGDPEPRLPEPAGGVHLGLGGPGATEGGRGEGDVGVRGVLRRGDPRRAVEHQRSSLARPLPAPHRLPGPDPCLSFAALSEQRCPALASSSLLSSLLRRGSRALSTCSALSVHAPCLTRPPYLLADGARAGEEEHAAGGDRGRVAGARGAR